MTDEVVDGIEEPYPNNPLVIYDAEGKAGLSDEKLMAEAEKAAYWWSKSLDSYEGRKAYTPGVRRTEFISALEKLYRAYNSTQALRPNEINELISLCKVTFDDLQAAREYMGLKPLTRHQLSELCKKVEASVEAERVAEFEDGRYLVENTDRNFHDPLLAESPEVNHPEFQRAEKTADWATTACDPQWSHMVKNFIIHTMDPNFLGFATRPMKFRGSYENKYGKYQLGHKNVIQSLCWLAGNKQKPGFLSDHRFTRDDREELISFVRMSWDHIKGV